MTETSSNPDQAALETDETLAIPPASDGLVRSRGGPVAHEPPAPDYGAYAPGFVSRIGLAIGRGLPAQMSACSVCGSARHLCS